LLDDLGEIAHIEPPTAAGAFHVMIGLGLCDAVAIDTGVARSSR
jgi:hypothetical protein